jgi:hypothetical protein
MYVRCAQKVLSKRIIVTEINVSKVLKGDITKDIITISTPLENRNCGNLGFIKGSEFLIYSTINEFADIYFVFSAPLEDLPVEFFKLKPGFKYWTNKCKRTKLFSQIEYKALEKLTNNGK